MGLSLHSHRRLHDREIKVLALDLAGHTGYSIQYGTTTIKVGTLNLVRGNSIVGKRNPLPMTRLYSRLTKLSEVFKIDLVVFEETFAMGAAKYRLDSLQFVTTLWAILNNIEWMRVSPGKWKKAMLGSGKASKLEYLNAAIKEFPDIEFRNDDMAAARWLLEYGIQFRKG